MFTDIKKVSLHKYRELFLITEWDAVSGAVKRTKPLSRFIREQDVPLLPTNVVAASVSTRMYRGDQKTVRINVITLPEVADVIS